MTLKREGSMMAMMGETCDAGARDHVTFQAREDMDPFAVERWEGEGGAPAAPWPWRYRTGRLSTAERRMLESLGAAVVHEWRDLPTDVQRSLFHCAADKEAPDVAPPRQNLARFLHTRRNEAR